MGASPHESSEGFEAEAVRAGMHATTAWLPKSSSGRAPSGYQQQTLFNLSSTMTVQCSPLGCARRLKWEDGLRTVLGISETVLDEIPDRSKPTGSIGSRLHQIANDVAAACASIVATVREVLDDRFWEESP